MTTGDLQPRSGAGVFPDSLRGERPAPPSRAAAAVQEIAEAGFTVLPGQLDGEMRESLRSAAMPLYRQEVDELGGDQLMADIGDVGVVRSPFLRDERFLAPMLLPDVLEIAHAVLGQQIHLNVQRIVMGLPEIEHGAGVWHRDHSYQDFTTSHAVSLTVIAMLDGSNPQNGGIYVLPGSHRSERFPDDERVMKDSTAVICNPGDVVVLDSALFHRNSVNQGNEIRHSVVSIYTIPLIRQNVDYPRALAGKHEDDLVLSMLLGYGSKVPVTDLEYRLNKLRRGKRIASEY